jgi:hypothetical protein
VEPRRTSSYTCGGENLYPLRTGILALATFAAAGSDKVPVIGTWEGESKCAVPDSPCHDEHVIYTIEQGAGEEISMKADKVVNGERQYMGTLPCRYDAQGKRLTCVTEGARPGDWLFIVSGDTMTGTLTVRNEHQLYRRIHVGRRRESKK